MVLASELQPPYVMGIDAGTQGVRVGIFDLHGIPITLAECAYPTRFPRPGWAEQDPATWWDALRIAVRSALTQSGLPPETIVAVSASATSCTTVMLDAQGRAIGPSLIWMDVRAADQARRISRLAHPVLRLSLNQTPAEWLAAKALWLQESWPGIYHSAAVVFEYIDWLMYRLTGQIVANYTAAGTAWYFQPRLGGLPLDFYRAAGLENLISRLPSRFVPMGQPLGQLRTNVAAELGLSPRTLVVEGAIDSITATVGVAAVQPGRLALITGSSNVLVCPSALDVGADGLIGPFTDSIFPGLSVIIGLQGSGAAVAWFKDHFGQRQQHEALEKGTNIYTILDEEAAQVAPGAGGLIFLEHFQGNRTPYMDPLARGALWGLSLNHRSAHVFRALLEGIAYGSRLLLERLAASGHSVAQAFVCGGMSRSQLWLHICADVLGIPLRRTRVAAASTLGSAILAATGAGLFPSLDEAAEAMVQLSDPVVPDHSHQAIYEFGYDKYRRTYFALKSLMHEMAMGPSASVPEK
jgi:ribulose kinase